MEQARSSRERVIDVARAAFLQKGYGATTILAVAEEAGVSAETIYKVFGGKAGLVRAIYERGLQGRGAAPAEKRSNAMSAIEEDPSALVDKWGAFVAEISPLAAPVALLVRAAASTEPELATLLHDIDRARLTRMTVNARVLARRGFLRRGVSIADAAAIMWTYTAPELYDLLVVRQGWSPKKLGVWVADALKAALLLKRS
jgi:AcrR family transcriptional regulator